MKIDIATNREKETLTIYQIDDDDIKVNATSVSFDEWRERTKQIKSERRYTFPAMCTAMSFLLEDR